MSGAIAETAGSRSRVFDLSPCIDIGIASAFFRESNESDSKWAGYDRDARSATTDRLCLSAIRPAGIDARVAAVNA